jgi:hypothetical protein
MARVSFLLADFSTEQPARDILENPSHGQLSPDTAEVLSWQALRNGDSPQFPLVPGAKMTGQL